MAASTFEPLESVFVFFLLLLIICTSLALENEGFENSTERIWQQQARLAGWNPTQNIFVDITPKAGTVSKIYIPAIAGVLWPAGTGEKKDKKKKKAQHFGINHLQI